jgi:hypothetical protein
MINQAQNIRSFVESKLGELATWNDAMVEGEANGDYASAVIPVNGRQYRLAVTSAYIEPPMGRLTLTDLQTNHEISGGRTDAIWDEMPRYARARTGGDVPADVGKGGAALLALSQ